MVKYDQIITAVEDLGQKMVHVNPVEKVFKNAVSNIINISLYPIKHKAGYFRTMAKFCTPVSTRCQPGIP
jgi:hypothetical protein